MNCFAMVAIALTASLVQAEPEELTCKAALAELAVAAQAAEIAAEAADRAVSEVDDLGAKLESCRKVPEGNVAGCAKLADRLKKAEEALDLVEQELTLALEDVDAAYDDFDIACSYDDGETNVWVRSTTPRQPKTRATTERSSSARSQPSPAPGRTTREALPAGTLQPVRGEHRLHRGRSRIIEPLPTTRGTT